MWIGFVSICDILDSMAMRFLSLYLCALRSSILSLYYISNMDVLASIASPHSRNLTKRDFEVMNGCNGISCQHHGTNSDFEMYAGGLGDIVTNVSR